MNCGCWCICHANENDPEWPGPCARCCEPGDVCMCGIGLDAAGYQRSIYPTEFTRKDYVMEKDLQ